MRKLAILLAFLLCGCSSGGGGETSTVVSGSFIETTIQVERHFLYALNQASGDLSGYLVVEGEGGGHGHEHERLLLQEEHEHGGGEEEPAGTLEELDRFPVPVAGGFLTRLASTPDGRYLYVADRTAGVIWGFVVDGLRGTLAALDGSPFPVGGQPDDLVMHPDGGLLFVVDGASGELHWLQAAHDGRLIPGGTLGGFPGVRRAILDEAGGFLLVAQEGLDQARSFAVGEDGALTLVSSAPLSNDEHLGLALSEGLLMVTASTTLDAIDLLEFDEATGQLTFLDTFLLPAGEDGPADLAVHPEGEVLVVANRFSGNLSILEIHHDEGELEPSEDSPLPTGAAPEGLLFALDGAILYVANRGDDTISGFGAEEEPPEMGEEHGHLHFEELEESPFDAGEGPVSLTSLERVETVVVTLPVE